MTWKGIFHHQTSELKKTPRDYLFVVNAVIHDTVKKKGELDLVFSDIRTCFDSLNPETSLIDLHSNGVDTSLLNLMHELSKTATIQVKTPVGVTDQHQYKIPSFKERLLAV